jgi:hypothetical protein
MQFKITKHRQRVQQVNTDIDKRHFRPRTLARGLGFFVVLFAFFIFLRPPVTWSEIYFLASLKTRPLSLETTSAELFPSLSNPDLVLHKAAYFPAWFSGIFSKIALSLRQLTGGRFEDLIGQNELVVYRLACISLAMIAFILIRKKLTSRQNQATCTSSVGMSNQAWLPFHPAIALGLTLIFVRWGAIEQLLILVALAALSGLTAVNAKLNSDHAKTRLNLAIFATALAFANSRTWTYSLLPAALVWTLLQKHQWANLLRIINISILTILIFVVAFLSNSNFEALVSHLTQRWLYLNEPRYSPLPWTGPEQILRAISFTLILCACRILPGLQSAAKAHNDPHRSKRFFSAILTIIAGLHIVFYQKNILAADVVLLLTLVLSAFSANPDNSTQLSKGRLKFVSLIDVLIKLTVQAWALLCVIAIALILWPGINVVRALSATASGMTLVIHQHPLLAGLVLAAVAIAFFMSRVKSLFPVLAPRRSAVLLFALLALLGATELRSYFLWEQLRSALGKVPHHSQLLYLPKLEPLVALMPELPQKNRLVTLFEGGSFMRNEPHSMLLVPSSASEVCRAATWNIDSEYGMFTLCDAGQGTLLHLLPLN